MYVISCSICPNEGHYQLYHIEFGCQVMPTLKIICAMQWSYIGNSHFSLFHTCKYIITCAQKIEGEKAW